MTEPGDIRRNQGETTVTRVAKLEAEVMASGSSGAGAVLKKRDPVRLDAEGGGTSGGTPLFHVATSALDTDAPIVRVYLGRAAGAGCVEFNGRQVPKLRPSECRGARSVVCGAKGADDFQGDDESEWTGPAWARFCSDCGDSASDIRSMGGLYSRSPHGGVRDNAIVCVVGLLDPEDSGSQGGDESGSQGGDESGSQGGDESPAGVEDFYSRLRYDIAYRYVSFGSTGTRARTVGEQYPEGGFYILCERVIYYGWSQVFEGDQVRVWSPFVHMPWFFARGLGWLGARIDFGPASVGASRIEKLGMKDVDFDKPGHPALDCYVGIRFPVSRGPTESYDMSEQSGSSSSSSSSSSAEVGFKLAVDELGDSSSASSSDSSAPDAYVYVGQLAYSEDWGTYRQVKGIHCVPRVLTYL